MNRYVATTATLSVAVFLAACSGGSGQQTENAPMGPRSVRIRWTKSTDPDVIGYRVYRGQSADFSLPDAPFVSAGPNATAVVVPDLTPGKYFFKVVAMGTLAPANGKGGVSEPVLVEATVP